MAKLFLLRHLKSQWNEDNRFAGWVDNPLSKKTAAANAKMVADKLINVYKSNIDVMYSSSLIRNVETILRIYENIVDKYPLFIHMDGGKMQKWGNFTDISQNDVPVYVTENLNERYYGKMQGLDKGEAIKQYGADEIQNQRRAYLHRPPGGESLKDVYNRAVPLFKKYVGRDLTSGKNVMVVASHNTLRAIVKYIEQVSDADIKNVELPFGSLVSYDFDDKLVLTSKKYYDLQ